MAMKAKQVKDLWEAYSKVYQNLDEVKSSESSAANYLEKDKKIPPGTKVQVKPMEEEVDVYDLIRSYLIDEGYAETPEAAFAIMANMSEEWRESIVEGKKPYPAEKVKNSLMKKSEYIGYEDQGGRAERESERGEKQYQVHKKMMKNNKG